MAQQTQQSPAASDRSSASSWIDINKHDKHATVPNPNLPMGAGFAAGATAHNYSSTQASTVYGSGVRPICIQPLTPIRPPSKLEEGQQIPVKMPPQPFPGFNYIGVPAREQSQQPSPHPSTSLFAGSTALYNMPVTAFVTEKVRSCCATECHALVRGHPTCLFAYHRAAELWGLAQGAQAKHNSDMADITTQPGGGTLHPYGAIGEKVGGNVFQGHHFPSVLATTLPSPPPGFGERATPPGNYLRPMMGFGPVAPGEFRPMISVSQAKHTATNQGTPQHRIIEAAAALNQDGRALQGHDQPQLEATDEERVAMGYSPRYQGNIWLQANRSANIPDEHNCSLFLIHLPPDLTTHKLLATVHKFGPTGRIYATHINAPEPARGNLGCAAKVVFFTRAAAALFFDLCQRCGFYVDGRRAHVTWNRIKTAERPDLADASRVLLLSGPRALVNPRTLTDFLRTKLEFQIDEILVLDEGTTGGLPSAKEGDGRKGLLLQQQQQQQQQQLGGSGGGHAEDAIVEYRFGSFRCQAQAAKMALARVLPQVRCFFGEDPLAPEAWRHDEYTRRMYKSYSEAPIQSSLRL